ncbi:MAG: hypothetical protein WC943_06050 [Elusimicrobiota bacterium]
MRIPRPLLALVVLLPLSSPAFSQQIHRVRVPTSVGASSGFSGGAYAAAASVHSRPLAITAMHGLPVAGAVLPSLAHPQIQAVPGIQQTIAVPAVPAAAGLAVASPSRDVAPAGPVESISNAGSRVGASDLKFPRGARGVALHEARTSADVDRLIAVNPNSIGLIAGLKNAIKVHGPVKIRVYTDAYGKTFSAIDLQGAPQWAGLVPELEPHEVNLIRKILRVTDDVQVVVREEGKTPDLIVAGEMTEIKSDMNGLPSAHLIDKANQQVRDFGLRHGIVGGGLAMDLVHEPFIETERVLGAVNDWAGKTRRVELGRILMFAADDVRFFALGADGLFEVAGAPAPSSSGGAGIRRLSLPTEQGVLGRVRAVHDSALND